jgi:hypothetical protein
MVSVSSCSEGMTTGFQEITTVMVIHVSFKKCVVFMKKILSTISSLVVAQHDPCYHFNEHTG